jgi:ribosomal protein S18 acetylase RimI-like enzyme
MTLSLQPASQSDHEFLYRLHCATMRDYVDRTWGWDDDAQRIAFDIRLSTNPHQVILFDGDPVGMLEIEHHPTELVIANIQVLPEYQGRGIGSAVIREVIDLAQQCSVVATLQVLEVNVRARRLYERLGFRAIADAPPHIRMRA